MLEHISVQSYRQQQQHAANEYQAYLCRSNRTHGRDEGITHIYGYRNSDPPSVVCPADWLPCCGGDNHLWVPNGLQAYPPCKGPLAKSCHFGPNVVTCDAGYPVGVGACSCTPGYVRAQTSSNNLACERKLPPPSSFQSTTKWDRQSLLVHKGGKNDKNRDACQREFLHAVPVTDRLHGVHFPSKLHCMHLCDGCN